MRLARTARPFEGAQTPFAAPRRRGAGRARVGSERALLGDLVLALFGAPLLSLALALFIVFFIGGHASRFFERISPSFAVAPAAPAQPGPETAGVALSRAPDPVERAPGAQAAPASPTPPDDALDAPPDLSALALSSADGSALGEAVAALHIPPTEAPAPFSHAVEDPQTDRASLASDQAPDLQTPAPKLGAAPAPIAPPAADPAPEGLDAVLALAAPSISGAPPEAIEPPAQDDAPEIDGVLDAFRRPAVAEIPTLDGVATPDAESGAPEIFDRRPDAPRPEAPDAALSVDQLADPAPDLRDRPLTAPSPPPAPEPETDTESETEGLRRLSVPASISTEVAAPRVVVHYGPDVDEAAARRFAETLRRSGFDTVEIRSVIFPIRETSIRHFFERDLAAARRLHAERLDGLPGVQPEPRDFSDYRPLPEPGLLEVWLARETAQVTMRETTRTEE